MSVLRFSRNWSKLDHRIFTTIRDRACALEVGKVYEATYPGGVFKFEVIGRRDITRDDITESVAQADADMSRSELLKALDTWYGSEQNELVLLTLCKIAG